MKNNKWFFGRDNELLKVLLEFYKSNDEKDKDFKKRMGKLFMTINYSKIDLKEVDDSDKKILEEFIDIKSILHNVENVTKRISMLLDCDDKSKEIIFKYYMRDDGMLSIDEKDKSNIDEDSIIKMLNSKTCFTNTKLLIVLLIIVVDLDIQSDIKTSNDILLKLLTEYKSNNNNDTIQLSIPKCMKLFVNEDSVKVIKTFCGDDILLQINAFYGKSPTDKASSVILDTLGLDKSICSMIYDKLKAVEKEDLSAFNITECNVRDKHLKYLSSYFATLKNIKKLYLSGNSITDNTMKELCNDLKHCPDLQVLHLGRINIYIKDNLIGTEGINYLCDTIPYLSNLEELSLHRIII